MEGVAYCCDMIVPLPEFPRHENVFNEMFESVSSLTDFNDESVREKLALLLDKAWNEDQKKTLQVIFHWGSSRPNGKKGARDNMDIVTPRDAWCEGRDEAGKIKAGALARNAWHFALMWLWDTGKRSVIWNNAGVIAKNGSWRDLGEMAVNM